MEMPAPLWEWVCEYASQKGHSKKYVAVQALEAFRAKKEKK
jgi:hypothetical protein